jgi:predicted P-loop ATPase
LLSAVGHWIVELGELESTFKKDVARLKGFLTADQDKVRRPYAKVDSEYQRRTVFTATVNDGCFLVDSTGNTRFWTIPVVSINYQHGIDMQQLFAQIKTEYEAGAQWWLTAEEEEWLEHFNKDYRVVSAIRERLADRLNLEPTATSKLASMSVTRVLAKIGIENPTNQQIKECREFLTEHFGEPTRTHGLKTYRIRLRESSDIDELD